MQIGKTEFILFALSVGFLIAKEVLKLAIWFIKSTKEKSGNGKLEMHKPPCKELEQVRDDLKQRTELIHTFEMKMLEELGKLNTQMGIMTTSIKFIEKEVRNGKS